MTPQTVATLFGLALFSGAAATIAGVAAAPLRALLNRFVLPVTGAVAVGAAAGSLYFSERAGFIPCELCWFQRIAMYPMALILPMAAIRRDRGILPYAIALSGVGLAISTYHVYIQLFPAESNFCEISNPCSAKWVEAFGWLTIPQMAGLSFALILVASITGVVADRRLDRGDDATTPDHESTASPRSPTR